MGSGFSPSGSSPDPSPLSSIKDGLVAFELLGRNAEVVVVQPGEGNESPLCV